MNIMRITILRAALLVAVVAVPLLGASAAEARSGSEPFVGVSPNGVPRDLTGLAYLGKQHAILEHLDRAPRFRSESVGGPAAADTAPGGVARDPNGRAYVGKWHQILERLG